MTNRFSGTVCLRHLPLSLQELAFGENELSGVVDLTCLPFSIEKLWRGRNNFELKTDFSQFPGRLEELDISYTNLSGEIVARNRTAHFYVKHSNVEVIR